MGLRFELLLPLSGTLSESSRLLEVALFVRTALSGFESAFSAPSRLSSNPAPGGVLFVADAICEDVLAVLG